MRKGRNISAKNLKDIFEFIENFIPVNKIEERDKLILKLAYIENMSSLSIAKLNNPLIVGMGNRSNKQLSGESISRIIKSYNLEKEKRRDTTLKNEYNRRKNITMRINRGEIKHIRKCGICGCTSDLQLHHMIPIELGGNDSEYNLVYLCDKCHYRVHENINKVIKPILSCDKDYSNTDGE